MAYPTDSNTFPLFLYVQIVSHRKSQPLLQRTTFPALRVQDYASFDAMGNFTDDDKELTGEDALTVKYMFEHADDFHVGERHSEDNYIQ
jgi:NAD(P)H dehydrogenase (quinone)